MIMLCITSESAYDTILANGLTEYFCTAASLINISAHPASFNLDALPAVIVPFLENAGLINPIFSLTNLACSSSIWNTSYVLSLTTTGTISDR